MNPQQKLFRILSGLVGILIALVAVVIIKELKSISYVGVDVTAPNTISVTGTGDEVVVPDIATFSFGVTEMDVTVADAQTKATKRTNAALAAISAGGVADKDIQTLSYSIDPHYETQSVLCTVTGCPPERSVITGYDVSQTIQVKVRDITKAGALLSAVGALGVQNISGLSFSVDNIDTVKAEARTKAIADAQSKAKELAKELGVSLDKITSYYDSGTNEPQPVMYAMSSGAMAPRAAVAPEVPVGDTTVTSNVTITYSIQ